jgi:type IV fimbrial biogenesis protein FimT
VSADGETCGAGDWNQGWIVTSDGTNVTGLIYHEAAISNNFHMTNSGGIDEFVFQPTGVNSTSGTFTICRATPVGPSERVLRVDTIGRAYIQRTTAGSCP